MESKIKKIKKIIRVWHWEWVHGQRMLIVGPVVEFALLLAVLILYRLQKGLLFQVVGAIMGLPAEFYAFLGLDSTVKTGNFSFYLFYILMLMNVWNAWIACERVFEDIDRDEVSGSIFMICNQWFDRKWLAWGKWSWNIVSLVARQTVLYLWAMLLVLIGSLNGEQRLGGTQSLVGSWCICLLVSVFFATLSFWRSASGRHRLGSRATGFRMSLFWIPFILGNLYKVRDALFALFELLGKPMPGRIANAFGWMNHLYWISPLSWMNIYREYGDGRMWIQCCVCVVISAGALLLGIRRYRTREFLS